MQTVESTALIVNAVTGGYQAMAQELLFGSQHPDREYPILHGDTSTGSLAVNMTGERANERMLANVYTEKKIEELAELTLNIVATNCWQGSKASACRAFKPLTPEELRELDIQIRENILRPDDQGYVVAPQHVFLSPGGSVILSVPYEVTAHELEWCFVTAIQTTDPESEIKMSAKARAPKRLILGDVYDVSMGTAGRILTREEVLELIDQLRRGILRGGERASAFRSIITADEPEARDFALDELRGSAAGSANGGGRGGRGGGGGGGGGGRGGGGGGGGGNNQDRRPQVLHQIGVNSPPSYWEVVVEFIGDSKDEVRNEAAVALEQLAAPKSYRSISSALRKEKVVEIEKNLLRALGATGAEEKSARSMLLKVAKKDREALLRVNAIVSLGYLLRDEEVVEFLTETFRSGEPREQAAAAIAMGLSREEEWLSVLDPKSAAAEEGDEEAEADPLDLDEEVAAAVEAAKRVLTDGGLAPLESPVTETAEDELRRERLFGGGGGRGGEGARGEDGGGRGGGGRGGGRGGGGDDPEDETANPDARR
ncbi:MAG: hypothetical protein HRU14_17705 [Planctomycetes bacterium]|nr:hypothetical protein [Planctomycetota bacterium]